MPKDMPDNESNNESNESNHTPSAELLSHPAYEELMQKLNEVEEKSNQYWERILRMQADNENLKRRVERDISNAHKFALEKFATALIPIIDSLELCLSSSPADLDEKGKAILEGVELTLKMFYNILEKFNIEQVNPVSETFDPEFQQAISMHYDPNVSPGKVISVLQKGYTLNNRLLRPALVVVAKEKE